jgi:formylglycine-generating enzyme required for sulfatase activity
VTRSFLVRSAAWALLIFLLSACSSGYQEVQVPDAQRAVRSLIDSMVLVFVPAGEFQMGSEIGSEDEQPVHAVNLNAFWIDQTEVTNAMYLACIAADGCSPLAGSSADLSANPDFPVQGAAWHEAVEYCVWAGRRLPTEAEWEKAARGTDGRLFPWGNGSPSGELANFDQLHDGVVAVGSLPAGASPYGALDMAGNVYEWVADWYGEDYYASSPSDNPHGPESGIQRVLRGGAWNSRVDNLRSANRFWAFPGRNDFDGFRCALDAID